MSNPRIPGDGSLNELQLSKVRVRTTIRKSKFVFGRFLSPEGCLLLLIEGDHATSPTGLNELPYGLTLSGASDCPEHVMHIMKGTRGRVQCTLCHLQEKLVTRYVYKQKKLILIPKKVDSTSFNSSYRTAEFPLFDNPC